MKRSLFTAAALFCLVPVTQARADHGPRLVRAPVDKVFVPLGFDDNDNVEVVIHGDFPNTCYKIGPAVAKVDYTTNTITIDAQSYLYSGMCGQIVFPYVQSIKIGVVQKGTYKIVVADTPQADTLVPLTVTAATSPSPDDFLYASVESADIVKNDAGHDQLRVEGVWPYTLVGCMTMKEVRAEMTPGNVLVVRPIAELQNAGAPACDGQRHTHKFTIDTPLAQNLTEGEYLIHVRVLNGNSYNRFFRVMHTNE